MSFALALTVYDIKGLARCRVVLRICRYGWLADSVVAMYDQWHG